MWQFLIFEMAETRSLHKDSPDQQKPVSGLCVYVTTEIPLALSGRQLCFQECTLTKIKCFFLFARNSYEAGNLRIFTTHLKRFPQDLMYNEKKTHKAHACRKDVDDVLWPNCHVYVVCKTRILGRPSRFTKRRQVNGD